MERESVQPPDRPQWRDWLAANHATSPGAWVVFPKKSSGQPGPSYEDLVEEALCFGWVDSTSGRVDDILTKVYIAPRRKGGTWAASNKGRVARLTAAGLMTSAGQAAIDRAKADGSWSILDEIDAGTIPDDLTAAFARYPGSSAQFDAFTAGTRRQLLLWLSQARRPATRERRVDDTARMAQQGRPASQPTATEPT